LEIRPIQKLIALLPPLAALIYGDSFHGCPSPMMSPKRGCPENIEPHSANLFSYMDLLSVKKAAIFEGASLLEELLIEDH
jgi:hypothetical protein